MHKSTPEYTEINSNKNPEPMEGETFLPVHGYPDYEVSDFGRIVSYKGKQPRVIKGRRDSDGYIRVDLRRDGKAKIASAHRLIAHAHLGPAPTYKPYVLHANDIPADNRIVNLRYGTSVENNRDRVLNGGCPQANKTHCPQGHAYVAANTRVGSGRRYCISCKRARNAADRAKKAGRSIDFNEYALDSYMSLTTAPGADLSPVLSAALAAEVVG